MDESKETAQQRFNRLYISSSEICARLKLTRSSIRYARLTGLLPDPIFLGGKTDALLWERESVEGYIQAWDTMLKARRARNADKI